MHGRVTVSEAVTAAGGSLQGTSIELVKPFVEAAARVIQKECGEQVAKGKIARLRSPQTTNEVSSLIAMTGDVAGLVIYSMTALTACGFASRMINEPVDELDEMAQSAIAELANMITGQAGIGLEQNGISSDMSPPVVLLGRGSSIVTFHLDRLVLPLVVSFGEFQIEMAIRRA
jgi:chemotaxis protein CheX